MSTIIKRILTGIATISTYVAIIICGFMLLGAVIKFLVTPYMSWLIAA